MKYEDYYVYLHRRGDNNEVFYVGKGRGRRSTTTSGRNKWWKNVYNKHGFSVEHVETGLCEEDAFSLEVELIKFYKENNHVLCNITCGGEGCSIDGNSNNEMWKTYQTKDTVWEHSPGEILLALNRMTFAQTNLSVYEYSLLSFLVSIIDANYSCCPPLNEIIEYTGMSTATVERVRKSLTQKGYMTYIRSMGPNNSNLYTICLDKYPTLK